MTPQHSQFLHNFKRRAGRCNSQPIDCEGSGEFDVPLQGRLQLTRLDNAKANLNKPSDKAEWIKLDSLELVKGNSQDPNGDIAQAAKLWQPPDA